MKSIFKMLYLAVLTMLTPIRFYFASGANYTKAAAPSAAGYLGAEWDGKVRSMVDTYTFASEAIGTVVNVGILRTGEVFLGANLYCAALGASTTLQLGDATDDDRFITAQSTSSAVVIQGKEVITTGIGYKATADTPLIIKTAGGVATGAFNIVIFKSCPN